MTADLSSTEFRGIRGHGLREPGERDRAMR